MVGKIEDDVLLLKGRAVGILSYSLVSLETAKHKIWQQGFIHIDIKIIKQLVLWRWNSNVILGETSAYLSIVGSLPHFWWLGPYFQHPSQEALPF